MLKNRKNFAITNRFQEKIILLSLIPVWLILIGLIFSLLVLREQIIKGSPVGYSADLVSNLLLWAHQSYMYILLGLGALFAYLITLVFKISKDLLGAFTRIIPQLDKVIEEHSNKPITARPKDELANELLKRINVLIQRSAKDCS